MEIKALRAIETRNIYCSQPVIVMELDLGQYDETFTCQLEGFNKRLLKILPGLAEHHCSRGKPGGFVERLEEGTLLGHVTEHVALELQYRAGCDVVYGKTRWTGRPGIYEVVFEYEVKEGGLLAAKQAVQLIKSILQEQPWSLEENLEKLRRTIAEHSLGPSTKAIIEACRRRDIPVLPLGAGSLLQLGYGVKQRWVQATITEKTSCLAVDIAGDKSLTKRLLAEMGIPVPRGAVVETLEEALDEARRMGTPVVIKPYNGRQGKGVSLNLRTPQEINTAFHLAKNYSDKLLVEEYVQGKHYRLVVVEGKLVAAAQRIPTFVVGDGVHSVRQLIHLANQDPQRGYGHEKPLTKITIDPEMILVLTKQGLSLEYIPREGEKVILRENANLSTGGIAVDVTDQVHERTKQLVLRAVQLLGLDVAGVDLVTPDIAKPLDEEGGAIIEINAAPGIRMHHYPSSGKPRDVGGAIVDSLFPPGENGRIPLAVVTGTNGKTTTTRLIAQILRQAGHTVGYTTTSGIFVNDECLLKGDTTGPKSAQTVLRDKRVTAAVLETARGGMIRGGLGYDRADVAVITNIAEDHLGQDGIETLEELVRVKSLVLEALPKNGHAVLNADDPMVRELTKYVRSKIIYFSKNKENKLIKKHLGLGGTAVFVAGGQVLIAQGDKLERLMPVQEIALTHNGQLSFQVENSLAAVGAALALGLDLKVIAETLRTFGRERMHNPGRLEVYKVKGLTVVVDYGHNPAAFEQVFQWAKSLNRTLRAVIGVPGDRGDHLIRKAGQMAGEHCQWVYIKEDRDLRGRKPGEVAELLRQGVMAGNSGKLKGLFIELDEVKAFQKALDDARPGEVVLIFYEHLEPILQTLYHWSGAKVEQVSTPVAAAE